MANLLPILVQHEWEFIQSQSHLTARLLRIGNLLYALELSKETERYFFELNQEIHAKRTNALDDAKKSIKWLEMKFERLNESLWVNDVQKQFIDFKELIEGKKYALGISVVRQGKDLLIEAISKCPNLSKDNAFKDFIYDKEGLMGIAWPDYLLKVIHNSLPSFLDEYERNVTRDSVGLLEYLQILAQYSSNDGLQSIQSFMQEQNHELNGWQSVESNTCQFLLKIYFQRFESSKDYPIADERLLGLIKAFLDLFVLDIQSNSLLCGPKLKSKRSKDAEVFCFDILLRYMKRLKSEKLSRFTYEKMLFYCQKEAHGKPFLQSITITLIERTGSKVRKTLKNQGIDVKVVRGKAL